MANKEELIGETKYYLFYENRIHSKNCYHDITIRSCPKWKRFSMIKKSEIPNSQGSYLFEYPITLDQIDRYKKNILKLSSENINLQKDK
jgi:hypothetical protein